MATTDLITSISPYGVYQHHVTAFIVFWGIPEENPISITGVHRPRTHAWIRKPNFCYIATNYGVS
jgi:hypothetical protein